mmetsp:Transcript_3654/g.12022  ORF Transcript_3654/g.12022 Transcript_3654/m.12022 type:complete len:106 (-) Transcript_3654:1261-1578(-)
MMMKLLTTMMVLLAAVASGDLGGGPRKLSFLFRRGGAGGMTHYKEWPDLQEAIAGSSKVVVLDFTARWCSPCRVIAPALGDFATLLTEECAFFKIDVRFFLSFKN